MRIHLGHHFYGAGNLGDDFMLAGFLAALETLAPKTQFTASIPFPLERIRARFPQIEWSAYDGRIREKSIAECDVWLGLGGSPFQSAQSRWFVDHLAGDADLCRRFNKPMYYLGVGVQRADELREPTIRRLCEQATTIWTRDGASAERLAALGTGATIAAGADLAHVLFAQRRPPRATAGRVAVVANVDYAEWPAATEFLAALSALPARERIWLAQESRDLPGAEQSLFAALPQSTQAQWRLHLADQPGAPIADVIARWPTPEWLVTSRYHAAIASGWGGAKVVVITTNEKLKSIAADLNAPTVAPDADAAAVRQALAQARPATDLGRFADAAQAACAAFVAHALRA